MCDFFFSGKVKGTVTSHDGLLYYAVVLMDIPVRFQW